MTQAATARTDRAPRFRTIDGLRGIAAATVVLYHFNETIARTSPHWLPGWANAIASRGGLGVDIFFVISGFVVAFSVRDGDYSPKYLGLFALRRSIRLDPPYWVMIALEIALIAFSNALFPGLAGTIPSLPKVLTHLVYAQNILGYGDIVPVFWTLCFEIQFYVTFVGLLVLGHQLRPRLSAPAFRALTWSVLVTLFASSVFLRYAGLHVVAPSIALYRWFEFFLGVLTWRVIAGKANRWTLFACWATVLAAIGYSGASATDCVAVATSAFIFVVAQRQALETVLSNRVLQLLGAMSYSLYLVHQPIGERCISLIVRVAGSSMQTSVAWAAFAIAWVVSLGAAWVLWRYVEVPTMRASKSIRLPSRTSRAATGMPSATPVTAIVPLPT
jgi:hypothetical protein